MDIRERKGTLWKIYKMGAENLAKIEKEQKCRKNVEKNVDIYICFCSGPFCFDTILYAVYNGRYPNGS